MSEIHISVHKIHYWMGLPFACAAISTGWWFCCCCLHCLWEFCVWFFFCYSVLSVLSNFTIVLLRKKKCVALYRLSTWCPVALGVLWLFLGMPWAGLQCVIVVFPGHTHERPWFDIVFSNWFPQYLSILSTHVPWIKRVKSSRWDGLNQGVSFRRYGWPTGSGRLPALSNSH